MKTAKGLFRKKPFLATILFIAIILIVTLLIHTATLAYRAKASFLNYLQSYLVGNVHSIGKRIFSGEKQSVINDFIVPKNERSASCVFRDKKVNFKIKDTNKEYRFVVPYHYVRLPLVRNNEVTKYLVLNAVYGTLDSQCEYEKNNGVGAIDKKVFNLTMRHQSKGAVRHYVPRPLRRSDENFAQYDIWYSDKGNPSSYTEYYKLKNAKDSDQRIECQRSKNTGKVGYCEIRFYYEGYMMIQAKFHSQYLNDLETVKSSAVTLINKFRK